jgi:hypothetical protein
LAHRPALILAGDPDKFLGEVMGSWLRVRDERVQESIGVYTDERFTVEWVTWHRVGEGTPDGTDS